MSNGNHDQSVGGQGATDGLSGTKHSGTEGADSGQGVNKGGQADQHGHGGQHSDDSEGIGGEHEGGLHDVGLVQRGGASGIGGNATTEDDQKSQPTP
ncbi:hypothetical protein SAMN05428959_103844 [Duganella sp. CF517]|uniref:hypothetical protein n=1 Tax=Duganella sp. CF517 TaxID=1881038 RepID=UPI0008C92382|nr:hypothetical protein [Duganella sp. CF517]SEN93407.1 hypothetical protein SAMN05428959_103844 [Duganella sp. CF517]